jgi:hypothetical protein
MGFDGITFLFRMSHPTMYTGPRYHRYTSQRSSVQQITIINQNMLDLSHRVVFRICVAHITNYEM